MTVLQSSESPLARLIRHASDLFRLAVPVMVARAGLMTMITVDTIVVGRYGAIDLAWLGLAGAVQGTLMAILVGLLMGVIVLTAQNLGAGRPADVGAVFRRSIPYSMLIGSLAGLFCLAGEPFFLLTGQQPDLAEGAGRVMAVYGLGMPAAALFVAASFFLEGLKRPMAGMVATFIANAVNLFLDWGLVFGRFGLPELGAVGSAWATTIVRWGMAFGLIAWILALPDRQELGLLTRPAPDPDEAKAQRRLGYAAGLSNGLEASAFTGLSLFAGLLGALPLAAYTVGLNLIALPFMAALGIASATAVRVGTAHGAGDRREMIWAGWTGLTAVAVLLGPVAIGFALFPAAIAQGFATDPALIEMAIPVIAFSAAILVVDGGQVVMAQALRGRSDAWVPTALHFFSYFAVMMPVAYALGVWGGRGVLGLFEGIFIASAVSVTILSARFWWLSRR